MPGLPVTELPSYTALDVAKHNSPDDAWIIVAGKVYDVTHWAQEHPGGEDILFDAAGRDASREFEDVGHSSEARKQLEKLVIGTVRPATDEELRVVKAGKTGSRERVSVWAQAENAVKMLQNRTPQLRQLGVASAVAVFAIYVARRWITPYLKSSKS